MSRTTPKWGMGTSCPSTGLLAAGPVAMSASRCATIWWPNRSKSIQESLRLLREDLLDEIEDGLAGVKRGGKTLERALREMRETWEAEVNDLVNEAREDVDLAVSDLEEAIVAQSLITPGSLLPEG